MNRKLVFIGRDSTAALAVVKARLTKMYGEPLPVLAWSGREKDGIATYYIRPAHVVGRKAA